MSNHPPLRMPGNHHKPRPVVPQPKGTPGFTLPSGIGNPNFAPRPVQGGQPSGFGPPAPPSFGRFQTLPGFLTLANLILVAIIVGIIGYNFGYYKVSILRRN